MSGSALRAQAAPARVSPKINISLAYADDRPAIYRLRHQIYALELGQHHPNPEQQLSDSLDAFNVYVKAAVDGRIAGFVSITPPGHHYSVDKYFTRDVFPFSFDDGVYEVRLLTVIPEHRRLAIASLLMYAALRWIEGQRGTRIVAIGRREILNLYLKAGLNTLGRSAQSGAVTYELLTATVADLREATNRHAQVLQRLRSHAHWCLDMPFLPTEACRHGGDSFEAIGEDFHDLGRSATIINADVLDAWFPPSPRVVAALQQHLPFLMRTSPPTGCGGFVHAIARTRDVPVDCIVPAAGSSELIFLAFREWLNPDSRVLLLDPSYGEYGHVTEHVVGCRVDRVKLLREENYQLNPDALEARLMNGRYDLVVIVNPNSPTGQHVPRHTLESIISRISDETRVWIDETYVDYVGGDESVEAFAAASQNVVVCKSMSKVYALSGVRAAYACAPPRVAARLREISPPWAVSLPAQVAAVRALNDPEYYSARYRETHLLRETLATALRALGLDVIPAVANFLLCHLPETFPDAATVSRRCREHGIYIRDAGEISSVLGPRALRIVVKDDQTNRRMIEVLREILCANSKSCDPAC
ncbi:MAG: aminotransferase class I/II-fold pyridoxal phosphate-dependent enzyme [Acidobacteriia bacterium]|nr:aminotransferase class I/II-fold pyridoxal phosphate-dependent enzyme [Terriglobia bacterium]